MDLYFKLANNLALFFWLILLAFPRSNFTQYLIHSGISSGFFSLFYIFFIFSGNLTEGSFFSLSGLRNLFLSDSALLAGWLHYLAFDLLVGSWVVRSAFNLGLNHWLMIPVYLLIFMFGPFGFLVFLLIKNLKRNFKIEGNEIEF